MLSDASPLICNTYMRRNRDIMLLAYADCDKKERDLLIIHPHTRQLLDAAVVYAGLSSVFEAKVDIEAHLRQFRENEIVIYKNERYRFVRISESLCELRCDDTAQTTNNRVMIPLDRAPNIHPYGGSATSTGSQGIRKGYFAGKDFLANLVGTEYEKQAQALPLSTIVVCSRDRAELLADELLFLDNGVFHKLSDVFSCAWQTTSDDCSFFSGAVGKGCPSIVFTNRVSVARDLLYDDLDERIFSVIVDDINLRRVSLSELEDVRELLSRREKHQFIMLVSMGKLMALPESFDLSTYDVVYWSPDALLSVIDDLYHTPEPGNDQELMAAIDCSIDYHQQKRSIDAPGEMAGSVQTCKDRLRVCIKRELRNLNLDEFIICAFGLINLFEQICVPLNIRKHD